MQLQQIQRATEPAPHPSPKNSLAVKSASQGQTFSLRLSTNVPTSILDPLECSEKKSTTTPRLWYRRKNFLFQPRGIQTTLGEPSSSIDDKIHALRVYQGIRITRATEQANKSSEPPFGLDDNSKCVTPDYCHNHFVVFFSAASSCSVPSASLHTIVFDCITVRHYEAGKQK